MMLLLPVAVALVLLTQEVSPSVGDLRSLGVIAFALIVGAGLTYRYTTLPERSRADRAETREAAAIEREREAYQVVTPPLVQLTSVLPAVLEALKQKREP